MTRTTDSSSPAAAGTVVVMDAQTGKEITAFPITKGVDDMVYDPASKRICSAADGSVNVYEQSSPDAYKLLAKSSDRTSRQNCETGSRNQPLLRGRSSAWDHQRFDSCFRGELKKSTGGARGDAGIARRNTSGTGNSRAAGRSRCASWVAD